MTFRMRRLVQERRETTSSHTPSPPRRKQRSGYMPSPRKRHAGQLLEKFSWCPSRLAVELKPPHPAGASWGRTTPPGRGWRASGGVNPVFSGRGPTTNRVTGQLTGSGHQNSGRDPALLTPQMWKSAGLSHELKAPLRETLDIQNASLFPELPGVLSPAMVSFRLLLRDDFRVCASKTKPGRNQHRGKVA